jgi:hypothetical protein
MSETIDFVTASLNGDAVAAGASFDTLMRAKIANQIDNLRQTTAANLVATPGADDNGEETSSES